LPPQINSLKNNTPLVHNPIDKDKIAENPGLLPYAHTVGGSAFELVDVKRNKSLDVAAMHDQTSMQLEQIRRQMELLANQVREIQQRKELSELIYQSKMSFKPEINHVYYLYRNQDDQPVLSLIGPNEWGASKRYPVFINAIRLLADHTWIIVPHE
jgi:hypothetical protein